jgi:hypothetical protein
MFRRRETMIALRARRQALQIATKIAHPRVKEPLQVLAMDAPPDERPPTADPNDIATIKTLAGACAIIATSVIAFVLIYFRLFWPH